MILYRHPRLLPLEIWHGVARHASLYQLRSDKPAYFAGLREFLTALRAGEARVEDPVDEEALNHARDFDEVLFSGGEAAHPALAEAMQQAGFPWSLGETYARPGALAVFDEMGWKEPIALDLGQTQLKVITRTGITVIPRDLPFGAQALPDEEGRERIREFLRQGLRGPADGFVLALPNALTPDGEARPATYPGLFGPVEPLFGSLFDGRPWAVLNDAVLAARGYPSERKRLVVTLGFGVGAALWYDPVPCLPRLR